MPGRKPEHPAVRDFLYYMEIERNASPGTVDGYRVDLSVFLQFISELTGDEPWNVDLQSLTRQHVRQFLSYLRNERGNGTRTINRKLSSIRSLYKFLDENEEAQGIHPITEMHTLKRSSVLPVYLSEVEATELLTSILANSRYPERDHAIFSVFIQCGCRFSELLALTTDSINLENMTLRIFGKGRKERIVPLTDSTVAALSAYLKVRRPAVSTNKLFLNNKLRPLQSYGLRLIFATILEKSPLANKKITPHKLRHTCFTLLHQAGVHIRTVQEIAGHTSIATTQIYTHLGRDDLNADMDSHPLA